MTQATPRGTRERFITEAAALFSANGYAATSVADIQLACDLTGGSGALYKHFPSKRALLEEVVHTHVATMRTSSATFADHCPDELRAALRFVAQAVWAAMEDDREVLRVMLRDLDAFPDLLAEAWHEVRVNVYEEFTRWLHTQKDLGAVCVEDPAATAAVLLAALTYYPILDALIARAPGDIDPRRFAETWVDVALATLSPPDDV